MATQSQAFTEALRAERAAPERGGKMDLYGWLIGSWDLDVTHFGEDGSARRRSGEWHFGWVLEGRAIQDVWIVPKRGAERSGDAAGNDEHYGTTMRVYDPRIDAWRIQWTDPVSQIYLQMIGRQQGADIVQDGTTPDGRLVRWSFSRIAPDSFRWRGELSADEGATWFLNVEFFARRAAA